MKREQEGEGDIVVVLSSELIAEVLEAYFNSDMFKIPVNVVDLQASESGYAFTLVKGGKSGTESKDRQEEPRQHPDTKKRSVKDREGVS